MIICMFPILYMKDVMSIDVLKNGYDGFSLLLVDLT